MTYRLITIIAFIAIFPTFQGCNQGPKGPTVRASSNPWFAAAASNNTQELASAASSGADVNAHISRDYNTPLHIAAIDGNTEAVRVLLANGADPDVIQEDSRTPLLMACHRSNTPAALLLIDAGADLEIRDRQSQTAIMFAANKGELAIVEDMIKHGVNLDAQRHDGGTCAADFRPHLRTRVGADGRKPAGTAQRPAQQAGLERVPSRRKRVRAHQ